MAGSLFQNSYYVANIINAILYGQWSVPRSSVPLSLTYTDTRSLLLPHHHLSSVLLLPPHHHESRLTNHEPHHGDRHRARAVLHGPPPDVRAAEAHGGGHVPDVLLHRARAAQHGLLDDAGVLWADDVDRARGLPGGQRRVLGALLVRVVPDVGDRGVRAEQSDERCAAGECRTPGACVVWETSTEY